MRADGSEQDLQHGPVDLAPGDTRVDIEYAGLSFAAPLQISYRYKLEGFDRDWMDVGTRRLATYTNLPPRSYTFLVEARGRDGAWLGAQAKFPFRVAQPFYRRWRFLLLVVVLLAGAAVSLYRLRLRMLRRQFDAVLGERNRMARAIHDTLAQDFVGVALQLDLVSQLLASGKSEAAERQVRSTRKLVTEGLAEARRSIWELRGRTSEDSLPTRLRALVDRYSGPSLKIELQVGGVYRPLDPWMEGEFLSIAQEALSNVQRHASADRASVQLHFGRDMLVLLVTDKGRGFTVGQHAMKQGHFGVSGMYERADAMGATLMVVSEPGKGTTVTLRAKITGKETRQTA
jgi:signal transduction histidine kinase